jgi:uncharacterized protein (DUF433 family)
MGAPTDICTLITRRPEVRGGRPRIAGTRVSVRGIVIQHKMDLTPREIADGFGHVTFGQVYAALAYYYGNRAEIDADLAADDALLKTLVESGPLPN